MGIRIHKIMGYGLTDLQLNEDGEVADVRLRKNLDKHRYKSLTGYGDWLHARRVAGATDPEVAFDAYRFPLDKDGKALPVAGKAADYITILDAENAPDNGQGILIIRPYGYKDWYRYDDAMDYVEYQLTGEEDMAPQVQLLPYNPYPNDGNYRYRESGERLRSSWITDMNRALAAGDEKTATVAAKQMGFKNITEYQLHIYQAPPSNVEEFAIWSNIFKDPITARFLQPMLLTYWS